MARVSVSVRGCGESKSCYRYPPGCKDGSCDQLVTWSTSNNLIQFELTALTEGWVAIGLSDDKKMVCK